MTRNLRPLEQSGYVTLGEGTDPRRRAIALTTAGRSAIALAEPGWRAAQARVEARLSTDEAARLFALLDTVERIGADQEDDQ
jgi:DNA-binding MarR family transcriptional regulator